MSLFDKWDIDFVKSHKEIGNIAVAAFYYENDAEDSVNFHFSWTKQVDDLIGDSLFEAFNHTQSLDKRFERFGEQLQFALKIERETAMQIAAGIGVDINITKMQDAA